MRDELLNRLCALIGDGRSCREAAAEIGVSPATAIRWARRVGVKSAGDRRLSHERRAAIAAALREGATCAWTAARFEVSDRTAARIADAARIDRKRGSERENVLAALGKGLSRRRAAAAAGVAVSTAIRWAREAGAAPTRPQGRPRRAQQRRALDPERLAARDRVLAAVARGVSRRKAAALYDVPIATAIRWAREPGLSRKA